MVRFYEDNFYLFLGTEVKVTFSYGSIDMDSTYGMMKLGADIIVGTPSRLSHLFFGIEKNTIHKVGSTRISNNRRSGMLRP